MYRLKKEALCFGLAICLTWIAMLCSTVVFAETEDNGGQAFANSLQINGSISGAISAVDDVDYYYFDVPSDGVVALSFSTPLQSNSGDSWRIFIEDNGNQTLMNKSVSGGRSSVSLPLLGLKAGRHYVIVKAAQASKWNENEYTLSLNYTQNNDWEIEYNDAKTHAREMKYDAVYHGVMMSSSDEDWYKFQYIANDSAELRLAHSVENTSASCWKIELKRDSDDCSYSRDISAGVSETRISLNQCNLEDGAYYYAVLSAGSTYSDAVYSLSMTKPHRCDTVLVEAKPSTCKEAGNDAYYRCKSETCGKCYDKDGNELQNVMRPLADHTWGDWETVSSATCTSAETRKRSCSVCQKEELETLGEVGHLFNSQSNVERIEPTCTEKGEVRTYCAAAGCEAYQSEVLSEKGHDYALNWMVDSVATCTQTGWESRHCSRCDDRIDGRSISKTDHPYGTWRITLSPTCSFMGKEQRNCSGCDAYETRDVKALGHDFEKDFSIDRIATCTKEGVKSKHCTRCDAKTEITAIPESDHVYDAYEYDKNGHRKVCVCGKTGSFEAHGLTYIVLKDPTCMQSGVGSHHCAVCGWQWDEEIPSSEAYHDYTDWRVTAEPSCTADGERQRDCKICPGTQIQMLPRLPHQYQEEWTEDQAPSCTQDGSRSRHCKNCSDRTDVEVISATGHTFGTWSVILHPTCEEKGSEQRACQSCAHTETREINAKGHDFGASFTIDREATCDGMGEKSRHCSECSERCDITVLPELGHRFGDWIFATAPTCIEHGTEKRACSVCSHVETRETDDPLGHVFGEWMFATAPTCVESGTEKRTCSVCSHAETRETDGALGHAFGDWSFATAPTCIEYGTEKRTCSVCSHTETRKSDDALGHTFGIWTTVTAQTCTESGTEKHTCVVCSHPETRTTEKLGHDFESNFTVDAEASCEQAGERSRHCVRCDAKCDAIVIPALGHLYGEWSTLHQPTCTVGKTERRICSRCAHEEKREDSSALGHAYVSSFTIDKNSTCVVDGSRSRHCSRCDDRIEVTVIPATGHIYGEGVVTALSTAETFGIRQFTCRQCGYAYTETLSKLPPMMINSEEVVWKGSAKSAPVFRSAAALSDFVEVRVNGEVIGSDCYVLREGSTVVELTSAYLKSLKGGAYSLEIVSTTGIASAEFTVKNGSPYLWVWILVGVLLLFAIALTVWYLVKKKPSKKPKKETPVPASTVPEQMPSESAESASDELPSEISK